MIQVTLPHNIELREYQIPLWNVLSTHKRAIFLWARRHGKDVSLFSLIIKEAIQKKGLYYYLLPTYKQAKKVIWNGMTTDGVRFLDFIPKELILRTNDTEMLIELVNGSIVQLVGTDNYDSIRGTNPIGCVFSEYAFHDPIVWESVISPILKVNGGWAIFNSTPNPHAPKNHFYDLWNSVQDNDNWYTNRITIADTNIVTQADLDEERAEGKSEESLQIEYYCSFEVTSSGVVYSKQLAEAKDRITGVSYDKMRPVEVFMDIGRTDYTVILFAQRYGDNIRIIDCEHKNGEDIAFYIDLIEGKGYKIGSINLPHDAYHKRIEAKLSVAEQFKELYGDKVQRVRETSVLNGIQTVRKMFGRLWMDSEKCSYLLKCIENYQYEYDDKRKQYRDSPLHNWASHACDALRYLCVGWQDAPSQDISVAVTKYIESKPVSPKTMEKQKILSQFGQTVVQSAQDGSNPFSFK